MTQRIFKLAVAHMIQQNGDFNFYFYSIFVRNLFGVCRTASYTI